MDTSDFLELFVSEAREHVEGQAALLARGRTARLGKEEIDDLFRHSHSVKGMAAAMGFPAISSLAHAMEDLLHLWRDRALPPAPEAFDLLTRANDHLSAQIDALVARTEVPAGDAIAARIRALCATAGSPPGVPAPGEEGHPPVPGPVPAEATARDDRPRLLVDIALREGAPLPGARAMVIVKRLGEHGSVLEISPAPQVLATGSFPGRVRIVLQTRVAPDRLAGLVSGLPDVAACQVTPVAAAAGGQAPPERRLSERRVADDRREADDSGETAGAREGRADAITTIRVPTERMDRLLDGIGELILDRERLKRALESREDSPEAEILEGLGRSVDALRDEVMTIRLLPFSSMVPRLQRTVRELASRLDKDVELEVRGADVTLDRSTLEEMMDPLAHILRNSIDHGLESPADRRAAGKPARGRIEIDLSRRDERVCLTVADDGRGMDPESLRRVAVERRFLSHEAARRLSDDEALMLVTIPGFSTATRTTDISGRGVGMDVVRMRVQKLGGHLLIRSEPGAGTRLEMDLPPTVTVTRAFLCRAADGIFAVPVSAVQATYEVRREAVQASQGDRVLRRGEDLVTVLPLGGVLSGDSAAPFPDAFPALQYRVGRHVYALGVDEILGEQPIVVKPLRHPLELLPQYAGAAILNDGRIALIVDPVTLTRASRQP